MRLKLPRVTVSSDSTVLPSVSVVFTLYWVRLNYFTRARVETSSSRVVDSDEDFTVD